MAAEALGRGGRGLAAALRLLLCLPLCLALLAPVRVSPSAHILYYDYFKKGPEKKEIGRLWKNIIFPGIYVEYADTAEPKRTIKVETRTKPVKSRNEDEGFSSSGKPGTYNVADPKSAPTLEATANLKLPKLKPIAKPAAFAPPTPKTAMFVKPGSGVSVIPSISKYNRPKKPIVIYEFDSCPECKKVHYNESDPDVNIYIYIIYIIRIFRSEKLVQYWI
jgi:hypothetical protein